MFASENLSRNMTVYLAGYIQGAVLEKCREWRLKIRNHYENWKGAHIPYPIIWLDPMNGEEEVSKDGMISSVPKQAIFTRDYQCVKKCDMIVVNTDTFGSNRPLMGTIFEIAWAFEWHKPVAMITQEKYFKEHPFLKNNVAWYVNSVDELLEKKVINFFYKGWASAQY